MNEFTEQLDLLFPLSNDTWELREGLRVETLKDGVSMLNSSHLELPRRMTSPLENRMEWNEFHRTWNPPYADLPLATFDSPAAIDKKFTNCRAFYRLPWYLSFLNLWYGFKCWCKTGEWPMAVLYFPKGYEQDKELYLKVHAEINKDPNKFFRY